MKCCVKVCHIEFSVLALSSYELYVVSIFRKCAAVLEILRCVAFLAFDAFYLHGADISPLRLYLGRIIFSLSLVIWLFAAVLPHPADKLKET